VTVGSAWVPIPQSVVVYCGELLEEHVWPKPFGIDLDEGVGLRIGRTRQEMLLQYDELKLCGTYSFQPCDSEPGFTHEVTN